MMKKAKVYIDSDEPVDDGEYYVFNPMNLDVVEYDEEDYTNECLD
jgi:hypothetical protein